MIMKITIPCESKSINLLKREIIEKATNRQPFQFPLTARLQVWWPVFGLAAEVQVNNNQLWCHSKQIRLVDRDFFYFQPNTSATSIRGGFEVMSWFGLMFESVFEV